MEKGFVMFDNVIFQLTVGIKMDTEFAPLLVRAKYIQN